MVVVFLDITFMSADDSRRTCVFGNPSSASEMTANFVGFTKMFSNFSFHFNALREDLENIFQTRI